MSEEAGDELGAVRARIDEIDRDIVRLLNERAAGAKQVAQIKAAEDSDQATVFYRPDREAQILERVLAENPGPLSDRDLWRLFREIMSCCLSLEQPLTVAYLGPPGTYTEAAAVKHFGHFARNRAQNSIDDVFREVESGAAHCGVVPVENSTEGMVNHTLDCFMASRLKICGEVELSINHAFMSLEKEDAITTVYSHEQSLAQCRRWLDRHYPNIARTPMVSNAEAARVAARTEGAAAIAGEMAAERYG
ncbi:MAG: chorismate mutase, partial [Gammaproteobacteria bacterium]|nr:chorismate mutase [Gammaproteobacteria bacterium]